ncbi:hypothetical protein R1T08_03220 [Streptomyces sp. SBC-4]|nr:hypothetical protein [Streptomyces sp. SBC-4]MDV5143340.1 hypothetical protein [Streptomyces sp. SBC-4]
MAAAADHPQMTPDVHAFVADRPLPDWDADEKEIDRRNKQLVAVSRPFTAEEAHALAAGFGPDDCYGVTWSLAHLIETGPGPVPRVTRPGSSSGEWQHTLWNRWGTLGLPDDN